MLQKPAASSIRLWWSAFPLVGFVQSPSLSKSLGIPQPRAAPGRNLFLNPVRTTRQALDRRIRHAANNLAASPQDLGI